jgi:acetyl-CoA carboxylase biotin carboxylase subunit
MFKKVLIANRGEIALRIIRTCREMRIKTVAVYSTADRESLHVRFADEAVCIGPPSSAESYLSVPRIWPPLRSLMPMLSTPDTASGRKCRLCGSMRRVRHQIYRPTPDQIRKMGDKITAKETMIKAGVPVIPGSEGLVKDLKQGLKIAKEVGYPIILKATAGAVVKE